MQLIKKARQTHRFKVLKPFMKAGKTTIVGDEIEISDADQTPLVASGRVTPCLKDTDVYITLQPFTLPGTTGKFEATPYELVELKGCDAVELMLKRIIIPRDDTVWRPSGLKLKK